MTIIKDIRYNNKNKTVKIKRIKQLNRRAYKVKLSNEIRNGSLEKQFQLIYHFSEIYVVSVFCLQEVALQDKPFPTHMYLLFGLFPSHRGRNLCTLGSLSTDHG